MGMKYGFALGIVFSMLLVGCMGFGYRYYGLSIASYSGRLLAVREQDDKDFMSCTPTADDKSPCTVMYSSEFLALKTDYLDIQNQLNACQHATK